MALIRFVAAEWKMTYNSDFLKPMSGYLGRHFSKLYFLGQISLQFLSLSKLRISDKRLIWKKKLGKVVTSVSVINIFWLVNKHQ